MCMTKYESVRTCTSQYDPVWLCMTMYNPVWPSMTAYDHVQKCMTLYKLVWVCMIQYDCIWHCMTLFNAIWHCITLYDFVWAYISMHDRVLIISVFEKNLPVMKDVSGRSFGEEMTPWLPSAWYKRSGSGSHTDIRWVNGKKDWDRDLCTVPTGCYQTPPQSRKQEGER